MSNQSILSLVEKIQAECSCPSSDGNDYQMHQIHKYAEQIRAIVEKGHNGYCFFQDERWWWHETHRLPKDTHSARLIEITALAAENSEEE